MPGWDQSIYFGIRKTITVWSILLVDSIFAESSSIFPNGWGWPKDLPLQINVSDAFFFFFCFEDQCKWGMIVHLTLLLIMLWNDLKYAEFIKEIHYQKIYHWNRNFNYSGTLCENIGGNFNSWSIFPYCFISPWSQ